MSSRSAARLLAGLGAVAVTAATLSAAAAPAQAAPEALPSVTVRPDPSYQGQEFEGWGTSLVWFANATGGYSPEVREELYRLLFSEEGLNLNIARYNIGGGHAPDVADYLRPGSAVPGWWKAPAGTGIADKDWWDPADPDHWNFGADPRQRWWVDRIKGDVTKWETFSNSPPYFQTVNGYVSGGFNGASEQLRTDSIDEFTTYLVEVTEHLEKAHGIDVHTIAPFNEPGTSYWSTTLGPDGRPLPTKQEGAHIGAQVQQQVIRSLAGKLEDAETDAVISAIDETQPSLFASQWYTYPEDVRAAVAQMNVHTYGTTQRTTVRDLAKAEGKPLWMSEVEGSFLTGFDPESPIPGLGIAKRIVDDMRELEPSAWAFWQPVENLALTKKTPTQAGSNWGSIHIDFSCKPTDTLAQCPIVTNTKYDTARNFTHHIRPGDRFVAVDDKNSVAAVTEKGATVVHVNESTRAAAVTLDLTGFRHVKNAASVTPVVTTAGKPLVQGAPVKVVDGRATLEVPAQSVTTFLVDGVRAAAEENALLQEGHGYRLRGAQRGTSLTAGPDGAAHVRADDPASAAQLWRFDAVTPEGTNRTRYDVTSVADGRRLAVVEGAVTLVPGGEPAPTAQWIVSTTGDGTVTLVNPASRRVLEVGTADRTRATASLPTSGTDQLWGLVDETVLGVPEVPGFTAPGTAPVLPQQVPARTRDGVRGTVPATWNVPPAARWRDTGVVRVKGTATDLLGQRHQVEAQVVVDKLTSTTPVEARTFAGGEPTLPATVAAVGSLGMPVQRPVVWDAAPAGAYATPGTVTLTGRADAGGGRTIAATATVTVTEAVRVNAALAKGVVATATFSESRFPPANLHNGTTTEKGWSNWRTGTKNPSDTLTFTLPERRHVVEARVHVYRDGTDSYPASLRVQTRTGQGEWVDAGAEVTVSATGAPAPVVTVPFAGRAADEVRVVLTARPNTHMTLSEIEVFALTAAG
ncbi:hypothetical protein NUM3379_41630 [Kineococcus sp. NUM-3379]